MSQQQAKALLLKYKNGECTNAEKAIVEKWLFQYQNEGTILSDQRIEEIGQEIWLNLPQTDSNPSKILLWPRFAVAAAVLVITSLSVLYYSMQRDHGLRMAKHLINHDVLPGSNKAYLTLADGSKISLTEAANGNIANQAGVSITKTADGQLVYSITSDDHADINKSNTISTPKGGQWQIRLPDGSIVWLNAASSLTYPASFASLKERRVKLSGEAYFEIAKVFRPSLEGLKQSKERIPFIVVTDKQEVEVLGTHFNISSYLDEEAAKTTLLEGSVKINNFILKPGEQAIFSGNKIKIAEVDTTLAVAWKNGIFKLDGTPLKELMRQISRWYDIEIVYEGDLSNRRFYGEIERSYSLSEVLKVFELGKIHFRIEREAISGRKKLIVMP